MLHQFSKTSMYQPLSTIHDKYVVVPADKFQNNTVFVCKMYYIQCVLCEVDAIIRQAIIAVIRPILPLHSSKKR